MNKKDTKKAVEYLMAMKDQKMAKTIVSAFQQLDEDIRRERRLKKTEKLNVAS